MRTLILLILACMAAGCDPQSNPCDEPSNRAFDDFPTAFDSRCDVETLAVAGKQIESVPTEISRLTALNTLYLNDNLLSSLPKELFSLPVQYLYIHKNNFEQIPEGLDALADLRTLDAGNNRINNPVVGSFPRLGWLSLRNNGVETLSENFVSAPELAFLYLQDNRLNALPERVGEFSRLSILDASGNPLSGLPPNFVNLKRLQSLRLERAAFTDMPAFIAELDSTNGGALRELRLSGNPIPSEKRAQIQALVPKARIFW